VIVLLKRSVRLCVDSWFAIMPEGMEIMIAIENPNATTTNSVLIFLLDMFRTALVKAPKWSTFLKV
jgi:hypothetical protein